MTVRVSAFRWVPPFAQGLVRDLRVRWALEEAGQPYETRLVDMDEVKKDAYRALQPFGQVPCYEENGLVLFESGAIVLHIAERCPALMLEDPGARARVTAWSIAALNSIEPSIQQLTELDLFHVNQDWARQARPGAVERVQSRLAQLQRYLDRRDYLEDRFSAADILMTTVLRILRHTSIVAEFRALDAYQKRCESRPAFKKALTDQLATFEKHAPQEA